MKKKINVQITENGPIKLSHVDKLTFCGEQVDCDEDVYLCRCGESKRAPFCDGAHVKAGFSGNREKETEHPIKTWTGNTIKTHFNPNLCMHVFYCKPLANLRKRELEGDSEAAAGIIEAIQTCPSGALTYEHINKAEEPVFQDKHEVEIVEGGEIRLSQPFEGVEQQKNQPNNRLTLCRCGYSANKPFCDGKHRKREGFR